MCLAGVALNCLLAVSLLGQTLRRVVSLTSSGTAADDGSVDELGCLLLSLRCVSLAVRSDLVALFNGTLVQHALLLLSPDSVQLRLTAVLKTSHRCLSPPLSSIVIGVVLFSC